MPRNLAKHRFTMHETTMVFFVGIPILLGFANYLVPLRLGARGLAFPQLNALGAWLTRFGGLLLDLSSLAYWRRPRRQPRLLFRVDPCWWGLAAIASSWEARTATG